MRIRLLLALPVMLVLIAEPSAQQPPAPDPLKAASEALGVSAVKRVRYLGFGSTFTVGQSPSPGEAWPQVTVKTYDAAINYETAAMRLDLLREQGPIPPRGGGPPFVGEQRQSMLVRGTDAWDVPPAPPGSGPAGGPPDPNRLTLADALQLAGVPVPGPPPVTPQPAAAVERMLQIWLTPHGFLRAAAMNNATSKKLPTGTELSFTMNGQYRFIGVINARNEVEKVTTWVDNPVLGDMPIEVAYSNYQRVDPGVLFPLRIVQRSGGQPSLDLWVSSVETNPTVDITVPDAAKDAKAAVVPVQSARIADGVYYLTGGTHHSVAIEMRDHVVLVEAPLNEARATAVIAKIRELVPSKPIRYVVNTHHHFDHSGGLRTLVAEGATVVTQQANRAFYEKAWTAPRTITADRLSASKKSPAFLTFMSKRVLTDGSRTIEIHLIAGSPHSAGFAAVYLPAEKLLIEADAYTPAAANPSEGPAAGGQSDRGGSAGPATGTPAGRPPVSPATVNLYQNIERLKLDVAQIAALHGPRLATFDDLRRIVMPAATGPTTSARNEPAEAPQPPRLVRDRGDGWTPACENDVSSCGACAHGWRRGKG